MIFQPEHEVYGKVHQIDFILFYTSIVVKYNLSPETIEHPERTGFLASGKILCRQRIETCRDSSFPYVTSSPDRLPQITQKNKCKMKAY